MGLLRRKAGRGLLIIAGSPRKYFIMSSRKRKSVFFQRKQGANDNSLSRLHYHLHDVFGFVACRAIQLSSGCKSEASSTRKPRRSSGRNLARPHLLYRRNKKVRNTPIILDNLSLLLKTTAVSRLVVIFDGIQADRKD